MGKPVTYRLSMQVHNVEIKNITKSAARSHSSARWGGKGGCLGWRKRGVCVVVDIDGTPWRVLPLMFSGRVLTMRMT